MILGMIVQILKFKQLKWKALLVSFQPGFTVTPGRSSIQQTAAVSSVASRTPPMREWKTVFFLNCLQWNNYVVQFVCQHYVVIFTWTIAIVYHSVHWDDSWLILASFIAQHAVWVWAPPCLLIKHCTVMDFWICLIWLPFFVFIFCLHRNKAILFYFNMLKCANPAVLINLQCPTTQVGDWTKPRFAALCTVLDVSLQLFRHARLCKIDGRSH